MKKVSLLLLVVCVALAVSACDPKQTNTANGNANANDNANRQRTPEIAGENINDNTGILRSNNEKDGVIVINKHPTDPAKCEILNPASVTVALKKNKIKWIVQNNCPAADTANIVLEKFHVDAPGGATDPFGDQTCENVFVFDPIKSGEDGRLVSRTPKKKGTFKYDIKVILPDGTVLVHLDPQVVVT